MPYMAGGRFSVSEHALMHAPPRCGFHIWQVWHDCIAVACSFHACAVGLHIWQVWHDCIAVACSFHACAVGQSIYAPQLKAWINTFSSKQVGSRCGESGESVWGVGVGSWCGESGELVWGVGGVGVGRVGSWCGESGELVWGVGVGRVGSWCGELVWGVGVEIRCGGVAGCSGAGWAVVGRGGVGWDGVA